MHRVEHPVFMFLPISKDGLIIPMEELCFYEKSKNLKKFSNIRHVRKYGRTDPNYRKASLLSRQC